MNLDVFPRAEWNISSIKCSHTKYLYIDIDLFNVGKMEE